MSDRYFPSSPPSEDELRLILLLRYVPSSVKTKEGFFTVNVRNWELGTASDPGTILVPVRYQEHLRRFLWREMIFMEVIRRCTLREIYLVATVSPLVKRYIMYMDGILEGLLTTARKRQDDVKYRSVLFEMYLNVEYFVGRHEFDIAGQWRESHPDTILECQDALQLDWKTVYRQRDEEDPVLTGYKYAFKVKNVPDTDWQLIAHRVAQYLGFTNTSRKSFMHIYVSRSHSQGPTAAKGRKRTQRAKASNFTAAPTTGHSKGKGKSSLRPSKGTSMKVPTPPTLAPEGNTHTSEATSMEVDTQAVDAQEAPVPSPAQTHLSSPSAVTSRATAHALPLHPASAPLPVPLPALQTRLSGTPVPIPAAATTAAAPPPTVPATGGSAHPKGLDAMESIAGYDST